MIFFFFETCQNKCGSIRDLGFLNTETLNIPIYRELWLKRGVVQGDRKAEWSSLIHFTFTKILRLLPGLILVLYGSQIFGGVFPYVHSHILILDF